MDNTQESFELFAPDPVFFIDKGVYFGYPDCCITDFLSRVGVGWSICTDEQKSVLDGHGFIPCHECALKIIEGKETLSSLIKDRECKTPYPNG